jgi:hypothetical protein
MKEERIEYLYKYRPLYKGNKRSYEFNEHTLSILQKGELYFSTPKEFNDPFDCLFPILPYEITEKQVSDSINSKAPESREKRKQLKAFIKKSYDGNIKKYVDYFNTLIKEDPRFLYELNRDQSDKFEICCFSKNYKNILMWSHYADSHKGICIGIKTIYEDNSNLIEFQKVKDIDKIKAESVIYNLDNKKIPPVNYQNLTKELLEQSLITKSLHWKYEEEYRTILLKNMVDTQILKLKKENICQIIFGFKTPFRIIRETLHQIKKSEFIDISNLEVYQMEEDKEYYSLHLNKLPDWEKL